MEEIRDLGAMKIVLVTNTRSYSDNNSVAVDLAVLIAESGSSVALVDANLRRPLLHTSFQIPNTLGLSDILQNHRTVLSAMQNTDRENLSVLTGGGKIPADLSFFHSQKMQDSLAILKKKYDRIVIQGPPFFYSEALYLASLVDGMVLMIHPGHNKTETSRAIMDKFYRTGVKIMGIVMREQPKHKGNQSAFIDRLLNFDKHMRQVS